MRNRRGQFLRVILAGLLTALTGGDTTGQAGPAKPGAARKSAAPQADQARTRGVIDAAVAELKREYAVHTKDPETAHLRTQSTYFLDEPADLSPEAVLGALERPLGHDPRLTAYVRWQLLSAAPEQFDRALLPRLLEIYQKAPLPAPRFGMQQRDRAKLDALLVGARREDDVALTARLEETAVKGAEANQPVVAYRDELYARLPRCYEAFVAGFRDANDRTAVGGVKWDHVTRVLGDVDAWVLSGDADPRQCGQMAELIARLRFVESPAYYERAKVKRDKLAWATKTDVLFDRKKLAATEKLLLQAKQGTKPAAPAADDPDPVDDRAGAASDPDAGPDRSRPRRDRQPEPDPHPADGGQGGGGRDEGGVQDRERDR